MSPGTVLITGATGFLGRRLCIAMQQRGYTVRALARDPNRAQGLLRGGISEAYACDLPDALDPAAFKGHIQALIHCAYDTRFTSQELSNRTNVLGTRKLLDAARKAGVRRFVFMSSLSADPAVQSFYGQSKLACESMLDLSQDLAIRSGLILGDGGLFSRMRNLVRSIPVIPVFYGGDQIVQTIWVEDLCAAVIQALERQLTGIVHVAELDGLTLKALYRALCALESRRRVLLPFPGRPTFYALRMLEQLGLSLPISSENLLGLKALRHHDVAADLARIGMAIRPFSESLQEIARAEAERP